MISEFRTRGPNGANDEFVELYNNSDAPIDVSGWKIRGSSNSGSVSTRLTISSSTAISPRGHLLFTNSNGYSGSVTADQTYSSGFANDGGVALTLPNDPVVDQVGMSPGSAFKEGVHLTPLPSDANQSYERKPGGAAGSTEDTNNNSTDFQLIVPSDPQNLSSRPTPDPSPSPSPTPSPSVSPSPSPTPSPAPSPTATPTPTPSPSPGPSPSPSPEMSVVISQVYGGGGNSGAPFRNDFIEIFNSGGATINLAGWSVQYATSTGATWSVTNLSSVSLNPGQYYLVQESSGGSNGTNLPSPDATGTIAMAATAGKVALVSSTTALSGACPSSSNIVDMVGYGTNANCFRGAAPAPAPSNTTSAARKNDGCTDSQNNSADFAIGPPNPRNTLGQVNVCSGMVTFALIRRETVSFNLSTPAGRTGGGALCPTHFSLSLVTTRSTLENSCHLEFIGLSDKLMEALIKSLE